MKNSFLLLLFCLSLCGLGGCIEEYELPETAVGEGLLVVDGSMKVEQGSASVKLTRSQSLASKVAPRPETGATVWVENGQGLKIPLPDRGNGVYSASGLNIAYGAHWKLRIKTKVGKEYTSTEVSSTKTPPIDAITWDVEGEFVNIRVNTQDPSNSTRYYRWEYEETYEYGAPYYTRYIIDKGKLRLRTAEDSVYLTCYRYGNSSNILVGRSAKLANDVVSGFRIASINGNSEKLSRRYSMLVKQYAISREEHDYWRILRKNTEEVGSLFDAQPSQVTGNVRNLQDPSEPVLGYFTVQSVSTKRFFLTKSELAPYNFQYNPNCGFVEVPRIDGAVDSVFVYQMVAQRYVIVTSQDDISNLPTDSSSPWMLPYACADCREAGGTGKKPPFW